MMLMYGNELYNFINRLKRHKNIYNIIDINKIKQNLYQITFTGNFEDSVRKIFFENKILTHSFIVEDGVEKFGIIVVNDETLKILRDTLLNSPRISILKINKQFINISDSLQILTPIEAEIISKAYKKGFFDNPRKISLTELAKEFGITKTTLNFHIRNALKKIISFYTYYNSQ